MGRHLRGTHLRFGHHPETELGVDQWGGSFREVALIGQKAASAEATWTAQLVGGKHQVLKQVPGKRFYRIKKTESCFVPCGNIWSIWGSGDRKVPLSLVWKRQWFSEEKYVKRHMLTWNLLSSDIEDEWPNNGLIYWSAHSGNSSVALHTPLGSLTK